jgi:hypothetical protein
MSRSWVSDVGYSGGTMGEKKVLKDFKVLTSTDLDALNCTHGCTYGHAWRRFNTSDVVALAAKKTQELKDAQIRREQQMSVDDPNGYRHLVLSRQLESCTHAIKEAKDNIKYKKEQIKNLQKDLDAWQSVLAENEKTKVSLDKQLCECQPEIMIDDKKETTTTKKRRLK